MECCLSLEDSKSEFILTPVSSFLDVESNSLARAKFIQESKLEDIQKIRQTQSSLSPIWDLDTNILRKNLCANRIDIVTKRTIVLFILNKSPNQGSICLSNKNQLSTLHLVECNAKNWQACSIRIQKTIRGPRNTQKKLKFAEVPIDGYYIPTLISLGMQEQSNTRAKKILLIIANSIKTSVRKCLTGTY